MDVAVAARAGRPGWLNRRTVLGIILVTLSTGGGYALLEDADRTTPFWVAARDLASGSVITADSLRVEHVRLSPRLGAEYVTSADELEGMVVTRPLAEGELVPNGWLADRAASAGRSITVPIDPEHAVGGRLGPGDRVDIFATFDAGDVRARTVSLVRDVEVIDLIAAGGLVMGDRSVVGVTISVTPDEAQRVAFASRTAELDVVRIDDPATRAETSTVSGEDL